jgi:hypothetical protein
MQIRFVQESLHNKKGLVKTTNLKGYLRFIEFETRESWNDTVNMSVIYTEILLLSFFFYRFHFDRFHLTVNNFDAQDGL